MMKKEWHVEKSPNDMLYYIRCYNETGGMELTTWYGYATKQNAIESFHLEWDYDIYDPETKTTIKKELVLNEM